MVLRDTSGVLAPSKGPPSLGGRQPTGILVEVLGWAATESSFPHPQLHRISGFDYPRTREASVDGSIRSAWLRIFGAKRDCSDRP